MKEKLAIAALLPHAGLAGGVRRFVELGNRFQKRGHDFRIYMRETKKPDWLECDVPVLPLEKLSERTHDVVMCGDCGLLETMAAAPAKKRIVMIIGERYASKYRAFLERHPDALAVANSGRWNEYLPGVKAIAIPGGVNTAQFRPGPRGEGPFTINVVGRLDKKLEAVDLVLAAFKKLNWKDARVRIVADRPSRLPIRYFLLRKRIEQVSGTDQVKLVGYYQASDVSVTMERTAGWSNPTAEAMACGIPVICTRFGTTDFADETTALVVPVDDVAALVAALRKTREDPAAARARAAAALERIRKFDWEVVVEALTEVFRR
ncbi:MAG: glycosyltransferase family 4 protein [Planctomycetota bacterium]